MSKTTKRRRRPAASKKPDGTGIVSTVLVSPKPKPRGFVRPRELLPLFGTETPPVRDPNEGMPQSERVNMFGGVCGFIPSVMYRG
jgi:hypothetical protein